MIKSFSRILIQFLLFLLISPPLLAQKAEKSDSNIQYPEISKEIIAMRGPDQSYRIKYMKLRKAGKTKTKKYKKVTQTLKEIDRSNTARMKEIVAEIGWPTFDAVGERASNTAWLIVQHADRDPLFQAACLSMLKAAVDNGQAQPRNYAYLYDRVQLAKGKKQLYATQSTTNTFTKVPFFQAIADEANVQQNRYAMGVTLPVVEYAQRLNIEYSIPDQKEALERAKVFEENYKSHVGKARAAMQSKDYASAADHYIQATYCDGYTATEDYVNMARAISLAKHKGASWAFYYLMKAAVRGWDKINDYDTDPDFQYIKERNADNWEDLMRTVWELNKK